MLIICTGFSGTDVKLRAFGPHTNESFVTICPDDDYLFVVECIVTVAPSVTWNMSPLLQQPVLFSSDDLVGGTTRFGVNFILDRERVEMEDNLFNYTSQVQLRTDLIRQTIVDHGKIEISCAAASKTASILLNMQGM